MTLQYWALKWFSGRLSGFFLKLSLHPKVSGLILGGILFFSVGLKLVGSLLYSGGQYCRKWGFWKTYGCGTCYHTVFRKQLAILSVSRRMLLYIWANFEDIWTMSKLSKFDIWIAISATIASVEKLTRWRAVFWRQYDSQSSEFCLRVRPRFRK